jgi:hypothetical protein
MAAKKKGSRKYGKKASQKVEKAMHERKQGTLRSGRSGKKVKSKKQAVAIGLSQARAAGGKVPKKAAKKKATKKSAAKRTSARKSSTKRKATKKSSGRKKSTARKKGARGGS